MPTSEVRYFTLEGGRELGPVSFRELFERALREDDERLQVRRDGEPKFRSISVFPEFRDHFERHSQGRMKTVPGCSEPDDKTGA
jgi:hypothetical protein